jgi:hypothetical protein
MGVGHATAFFTKLSSIALLAGAMTVLAPVAKAALGRGLFGFAARRRKQSEVSTV